MLNVEKCYEIRKLLPMSFKADLGSTHLVQVALITDSTKYLP